MLRRSASCTTRSTTGSGFSAATLTRTRLEGVYACVVTCVCLSLSLSVSLVFVLLVLLEVVDGSGCRVFLGLCVCVVFCSMQAFG